MYLWVTTLLYVAIITLKVESRCYNFHPATVDYNNLCWKWWDKGHEKYSNRDRDRRSCVQLILKKCPEMLTISSSTSRNHDGGKSYETWTATVKAFIKFNTGHWMIYYEKEKKSVCYDDGVQECDYWWKIVKNDKVKDEIKEVCINNIWKHCRSKIEKQGEGKTTEVTRCLRAYEVKTVTYNYDGQTASFNQCVPVKKT